MNGRVTPVSGRTLRLPAGDDERLDADDERQADRQQRAEVIGGRGPDPQAALDDDQVEPEDRDDADDSELLAERREREVRVDLGDRQATADLGQAGAEAHARSPPRANACRAWMTW